MKNLLPTICFLFLLAARLVAQTPPHCGADNKFSIGSKDVPAKVYVLFLQEKVSSLYVWDVWNASKYYDKAFMMGGSEYGLIRLISWPSEFLSIIKSRHECILCSDEYEYSILYGHEDDIIDAVSSAEVQSEFNAWHADRLKHSTDVDTSSTGTIEN